MTHVHAAPGHYGHNHGPSNTASVVLDIGGRIGALILRTDAACLGREIEISRSDRPGDAAAPRTHSMVRERLTEPRTYDAVYPDLHEGDYTIWADESTPAGFVNVTGGQISTFTLA